jgi:hypothetical protein
VAARPIEAAAYVPACDDAEEEPVTRALFLARTPKDEVTSLPLAVLMHSDDFYAVRRDNQLPVNFHHHFHPKISPELGYDEKNQKLTSGSAERIEGIAVRQSRGQMMPRWLHTRYHNTFSGPELPGDSKAKFTAVVLACAGVVPRQAISLYEIGGYDVVDLSDKEHDFIRRRIHFEGAESAKARYNKKDNIGKFLARYAIDNTLEGLLNESDIKAKVDQFLVPKSESARREAGRFILEHAVDASVASLIDLHQRATEEGMVKKSRRKLGEVVLKYFPEWRFFDYLDPLEDRLSLIYG